MSGLSITILAGKKKMNIIQNTKEWIELRKNFIGSSDIPVIMGVSPWKTPYQLWQEKVGIGEETPDNDAMRYGRRIEELARSSFERDTGILVFPQIKFNDEYPFLMASLDGIDIEEENIVELKCPGKEDHDLARQGIVPEKYKPQLQLQMLVTGLSNVYYYSFDGSNGILLNVNRDEEYISLLLQKAAEFWECVQSFTPPTLTIRDYDTKNDEFWAAHAAEWVAIQDQIAKLEERENELRDMLISMTDGKNCTGAGVKLTKVIQKGRVNYNKILNEKLPGIDIESYREKAKEFWRITRDKR